MTLLANLWNLVRPKTQRELEEEYLAQSVDRVDLERRQRNLQHSKQVDRLHWF